MEEAQLQRGVHQEGGAQLSAATGKMFRGHTGPPLLVPPKINQWPGCWEGNGTGKAAVKVPRSVGGC